MGLHIRDERQRNVLTGLSQGQFDALLPVFSDIYRSAQQHAYEAGSPSGTRQRRPGGGSKGQLPTMGEKLLFVLSYSKTSPTFDVLGTQLAMARSRAHENLHKLSPILYDTLVHLERMPYRELATPEELQATLQGEIASSLMPPNGRIIVHKMRRSNVSMTAKKTRVAKLAGVSPPQAVRDRMRDHGESPDAGSAAGGGSLVPAAALARP